MIDNYDDQAWAELRKPYKDLLDKYITEKDTLSVSDGPAIYFFTADKYAFYIEPNFGYIRNYFAFVPELSPMTTETSHYKRQFFFSKYGIKDSEGGNYMSSSEFLAFVRKLLYRRDCYVTLNEDDWKIKWGANHSAW